MSKFDSFLFAGYSRAPLKCPLDLARRIFSYHQVMPDYLDFLMLFGRQTTARNIGFCRFRAQSSLENPVKALNMPDLNRSGSGYQICYNLKTVGEVPKAPTQKTISMQSREWSIRHAALHHQFDVGTGSALWIVTKGDLELKDRLSELTGPKGTPEAKNFDNIPNSFSSTLATHSYLCQWSAAEWDWYLEWMEDIVEHNSRLVVAGNFGGIERDTDQLNSIQISMAQDYEDKLNDVVMALEGNSHIYKALQKFYLELIDDPNFPISVSAKTQVAKFSSQLAALTEDVGMKISRAHALKQIVANRKNLLAVQLQSRASSISEQLAVSMHDIGVRSQKEAVTMRIVTVVTLIYLPPTFVSTFFSTDVVKYQTEGHPNGSFSSVALARWMQISIPLTILTLVLSYVFHRMADREILKQVEVVYKLPFYRRYSEKLT
ncbi:hypothetical protein ABW19_dt0210290 [Dactylella cylindrospora]|nr:hypothetical protein ABW19_dt0210290 [Dactylella cylindrospora]